PPTVSPASGAKAAMSASAQRNRRGARGHWRLLADSGAKAPSYPDSVPRIGYASDAFCRIRMRRAVLARSRRRHWHEVLAAVSASKRHLGDGPSKQLRAGEDPDVAAQLADQSVDGPVTVGEHDLVPRSPEPLDVPLRISQ